MAQEGILADISKEVLLYIIFGLIGAAGTSLYAFFKNIHSCLDKVNKRSWRIQKTLILMAKIIDDQTNKQHPEIRSDLDDIVKEMLEEQNGSKE